MKKILCLLFTLVFLAACDDSGTSADDASKGKAAASDLRVESLGMLPNCTESREGEIALVADPLYTTYKCEMGSWIVVREVTVEGLDDLSACTYSSPVVLVNSESAVYRCLADENKNLKWTKVIDVPENLYVSSFTDDRDGQVYKTVKIGNQIWMAENLNFKTDSSFCYDNEETNCNKYGRLYTWGAAMSACPSGWHLPDTTEWKTLFDAVGGESTAGVILKSSSGWQNIYSYKKQDNGMDAFGFSALPAGRIFDGYYDIMGFIASFWSSTVNNRGDAYNVHFSSGSDDAYQGGIGMNDGFSVRCLKD